MFLIFLTLISSWKPVRDTLLVTIPDSTDSIWIAPDHIWNASGTIDISNLTDSLLDSLTHTDDTLRLFRNGEIGKAYIATGSSDSSWLSITIGDSLRIKADSDTVIFEALGGTYLDLSDWTVLLQSGPAYLDSLLPATNDSSTSSIGTESNPYGRIYTRKATFAGDTVWLGDRTGNVNLLLDAANASIATISLMRNGAPRASLYVNGSTGYNGFNAGDGKFRMGFIGYSNEYMDINRKGSEKVELVGGRSSSSGRGDKFFIRGGTTWGGDPAGDLYLAPGHATAVSDWADLKILSADYSDTLFSTYSNNGDEYSKFFTALVLSVGDTIASASPITIGLGGSIFFVSGTADIDSIVPGKRGQEVKLSFIGNAATNGVVDGKNLILNGNFGYTADDVLYLWCDGNNWREIGRSAN